MEALEKRLAPEGLAALADEGHWLTLVHVQHSRKAFLKNIEDAKTYLAAVAE